MANTQKAPTIKAPTVKMSTQKVETLKTNSNNANTLKIIFYILMGAMCVLWIATVATILAFQGFIKPNTPDWENPTELIWTMTTGAIVLSVINIFCVIFSIVLLIIAWRKRNPFIQSVFRKPYLILIVSLLLFTFVGISNIDGYWVYTIISSIDEGWVLSGGGILFAIIAVLDGLYMIYVLANNLLKNKIKNRIAKTVKQATQQ